MRSFADIERANGGKFPGFAVLRHALSIIILLHHCRIAVRGVRIEPIGEASLQTSGLASLLASGEFFRPFVYALVAAFFALSGFLVAGSALRTGSVRTFLTFRALRILPALMSEVTLSAIILGACLTTLPLAEYYANPGFWRYFGNIAGFVTYSLPGVFIANPIADVVNINLWTLAPEFYCYLAMAALIGLGVFKRASWLSGLFVLATLAIFLLTLPGIGPLDTRADSTHFPGWFVVYLFLAGVVFYFFASRIPFSPLLMLLGGTVYLAGMLLGWPDIISCLGLVYFTLAIGAVRFPGFGFLERYDYSYGIYLYGYPIAQTLIYVLERNGLLTKTLPVYGFVMLATLVLTLAFSAISWRYIEKPFLALKRFVLKPRAKTAGPAALAMKVTASAG